MAIGKQRKLEPKNQKLVVIIICCIGVFIFPFVSDCQISVPGFSYTLGVSGQVVDKNGKPLPGAYILYDYHGYVPGTLGGSSPDYIKNPTITVTDTNGQFAIPSLSFKKPLGYGRPNLAILTGYSPITHSVFVVSTSGNHQKFILLDNTNNPQAWEKDLNAFEGGYGQLVFDNELGKIKNGEKVDAMLQSEHQLLNEILDGIKKRDKALYKSIHAKAALQALDDAIARENKAIELKPNDVIRYNIRGQLKREKGDLDGALADFNKVIELETNIYTDYLHRGEIKKEKGDLIGAKADFKKAMELNPKIQTTIFTNDYSMSITNSK